MYARVRAAASLTHMRITDIISCHVNARRFTSRIPMAAIGKMLHKRRNRHLIVRTACTPAITQKSFPLIHTRSNNAHVPKAPHRRLQSDSPTALGVGKVYNRILLAEKPIVRSPRPSKFNECLRADNEAAINSDRSRSRQTTEAERLPSIICDDHVKLLSTKRLYTSTTREATEEAALSTPRRNVPLTTLEREADPVRCRAVRYWPRPNVWQHYAREWDAMQLRRSPDSDNVDNDLTLLVYGNGEEVVFITYFT